MTVILGAEESHLMSDSERTGEDEINEGNYIIRKNRYKDDNHVDVDQKTGKVVITCFPDELKQVKFSEEELAQWQQQSQAEQFELLYFINDQKLQRAGRVKYQQLRDSGYIARFLQTVLQKPSASSSSTVKPEPSAVHFQDTLRVVEEENSTTSAEAETDTADQEHTEVKDDESVHNSDLEETLDSSSEFPATMALPLDIKRHADEIEREINNIYKEFDNHLKKTKLIDIDDAEASRDRSKELEQEHAALNAKIFLLAETIPTDDIRKQMRAIRDKLTEIDKCSRKVIKKLTPVTSSPSAPNSTATDLTKRLNLPKLTISTFDGNWKEWLSFKNEFETLIMKQPSDQMPDLLKVRYLKQYVTGDALRTIQSIQIAGENLDKAWKALCDKYDNPRKLAQDYILELNNLKPIPEASAYHLRKLFDQVNSIRDSLEYMGYKVEDWDPIIVANTTKCFDSDTRIFYELIVATKAAANSTTSSTGSSGGPKDISWKQVADFILLRCSSLENSKPSSKEKKDNNSHNNNKPKKNVSSHQVQVNEKKKPWCHICDASHYLSDCQKLRNASYDQKAKMVQDKRLCFNCLTPGHAKDKCFSRRNCSKCNKRHHTELHDDSRSKGSQQTHNNSKESSSKEVTSNLSQKDTTVLLPTAQVIVQNAVGDNQQMRALLDTGSQATFITERAVQILGLKRRSTSCNIKGIGNNHAGESKGEVDLIIRSRLNKDQEYKVKALILPTVTGPQPNNIVSTDDWTHLKNLSLADQEYYKPGKVDVLLGAEVALLAFHGDQIKPKSTGPTAHSTVFGWVVAGATLDNASYSKISSLTITTEPSISDLLQKFWKVEEPPSKPLITKDEKRCETLFETSTIQDGEGRFIVRIPFRAERPVLGPSKDIALRRLHSTENRIMRNPNLHRQYVEFMEDYLCQGHMEEVPDKEHDRYGACYLPHHAIVRPGAITTKLRVVFDASCKTQNGRSCNDEQLVGPVVQDDLTAIIMRFRLYQFAINGDISQMYRQIWVHADDRDFQRILWRPTLDQEVKVYRLKTVTYGTASAPYLATRCLKFLGELSERRHPQAAKILKSSFYMDDLLTGADTMEEAIKIQNEVTAILKSAGFTLRKFASNEPMILKEIQQPHEDTAFLTNPEPVIKTLGIQWNRETDCFSFMIKLQEQPQHTKRTMLSEIARIYDPLGWAAPVVVTAKIMYRQLWLCGSTWDEPLPDDLLKTWKQFREALPAMQPVMIPRWMGTSRIAYVELHGFCDASEKAYGAAVYLRCDVRGKISCNLVAAKTRVAPLKTISLPRLELCGAFLLSTLIKHVQQSLKQQDCPVFAWCDSKITLAWIHAAPIRWKTFVANRVTTIQEIIPPERWFHVKSEDNPADLASRGISPAELNDLPIWFHGPSWLLNNYDDKMKAPPIKSTNLEARKEDITTLVVKYETRLPVENYSNLQKLIRVTAYVRRLLLLKLNPEKSRGPITVPEANQALHALIKRVQLQHFRDEIKLLKKKKLLPRKSKLIAFNPFLDSSGLLRVGGRLRNADISDNQKFPIVLPSKDHLTRLIIEDAHNWQLHAGPTLLLATLRQRYWIIRGRQAIRSVIHNCVKCIRHRGATLGQIMGDLPKYRVQAKRAFEVVGVDYAGPIMIRARSGRGSTLYKAWIAIFVCFSTKAVHLEVVTDLTSEAFLAATRRFVGRRGKPSHIYSDQGTNFVGAEKELKILLEQEKFGQELTTAMTSEGIQWHFNPAHTPHMGGLWEAGVKSTKFHLYRVLGDAKLTYEELSTVLIQIEACLNSRPLCLLNEDPADMECLTPGHFLIGHSMNKLPDPNVLHIKENRLSRWQNCQRITQQFWRRWKDEYLSSLQARGKWTVEQPNPEEGTIVLIKEDNLPPTQWPMGRIMGTKQGLDDKARVMILKTAKGTIERSIHRLVPIVGPDRSKGGGMLENGKDEEEDE